jgi:CDP-glucose 4,6-dehydratase
LASCRAGNVIGGGDWAKDRIIPDIIHATINKNKVKLRSPNSIRPWQHVLDPLSGYLMLGQKILEKRKEYTGGWNFGPEENEFITVKDIVQNFNKYWNDVSFENDKSREHFHEAKLLKLDCSKAKSLLGWKGVWNTIQCVEKTALWYKNFYLEDTINTSNDLEDYVEEAKEKNLVWTK